MGPCGSRSSATPASTSRPATGRCCAIRGSRRRISDRGSLSRATTGSIPDGLRPARLPLRLAPAPRPLRSRVPRPPRRQGRPGAAPRLPDAVPPPGAASALGFRHFVAVPRRRAGRPRRPRGRDLRDDGAGRRTRSATPRSCSATARRACSTRTTPGPAIRTRCARSARTTRTSCSSRVRSGTRSSTTSPRPSSDRLAAEKRVNQMARARQYIEWVKAAHVFPCAGPPCFLDDDLFALNDLDGDPANIFPDQTVFLAELARRGHRQRAPARARAPSSTLDGGACRVTPARRRRDSPCRSATRLRTSPSTAPTGAAGSLPSARRGSERTRDLVAELAAWFEPLMERAPITSAGHRRQRRARRRRRGRRSASTSSRGRCGRGADEPYVYKIDVDRALVDVLVERPRRGLGELAVPVVPVPRRRGRGRSTSTS